MAERYRAPLIVCYLEGKSQDEAAAQLGLPKGTLKGRLESARKLLRQRLVRRGLGPAALLLAAAWPANALTAALPPKLLASAMQVVVVPAGQLASAHVSANVAALADGVSKSLFATKLKLLTAVLLTSAVLGVGTVTMVAQLVGAQPVEQNSSPAKDGLATNRDPLQPLERADANILAREEPKSDTPVRTAHHLLR